MLRHTAVLVAGASVWLSCLACDHGKKHGEMVPGVEDPLVNSKAFRDTVSQVAWVEGLRKMRVRGYGLVVGLGTRGSSECPRTVRGRMLQEMYKMAVFTRAGREALSVTPEQIIDDRDTAVVVVEGEIPAAASPGDCFDLHVRALAGTQTTSLEGGRLYSCNLRVHRDTTAGSIAGQVLATGSGPVFVNPWAKSATAATRVDPRIGSVLGGGVVVEARRLRLVLEHPSYRRAVQVANCINNRFTARDKVADGRTPAHVKLRVPAVYADNPKHFLDVARHLYLPSTSPGFIDRRASELAEELLDPAAPHLDIALAFEGIGRSTEGLLRNLYADSRAHVSFYSGLAGVRLGDSMAVEPLAAHARNPRSDYRMAAVRALADAVDVYRASATLRAMLDDPDPRIRVMAYDGLRERGDPCVVSTVIGGDNFFLDRVQSGGRNLIYVRRSGERRIAVFGERVACVPPLFFVDDEGMLTMSANAGDEKVDLLRRTQFSERTSPPIPAPLRVAELIPWLGDEPVMDGEEVVRGLNVPYSLVVKAVADLCRADAINADFLLEQTTIPELFGPMPKSGRGESDL
ncbi:MAG: hypothetical protein GY842_10800 [bacterium]|nr:hypothetical protein [bacterium]